MLKKSLLSLALLALTACQAPVLNAPQAMLPRAPLAAQAQLRAQTQAQAQTAPLFPVQAGYHWEYEVTIAPVQDPYAEEHGNYSLNLESVTPSPQGDKLEFRAMSSFTTSYTFPTLIQSDQGLTLQDMTFLGLGSDKVQGLSLNFVQAPLQAGQRWEDEYWIGKVKGQEDVTVPAGTFRAWRIEVIGTFQQAYTAVGDYWFVPGQGMVKSVLTVPGTHIEMDLAQSGLRR